MTHKLIQLKYTKKLFFFFFYLEVFSDFTAQRCHVTQQLLHFSVWYFKTRNMFKSHVNVEMRCPKPPLTQIH